MDATEFYDLQAAFIYLYGNIIAWLLVLFAAGSILASIGIIWLSMLQKLSVEE